MARLVFDIPSHFCFATELQIYVSHVNQGGHLDNAQLISLVSEARLRFFHALGYREGHIENTSVVVGDVMAQYKSEAFHGETLRVRMQPADFNRYGFDLLFHMIALTDGREVARGKTGIVFTSPQLRKVTPIPPAAHEKLLRCTQPDVTLT